MRNFFVYGLVTSVLMLMSFPTFADFSDGLVMYLPFDEGAGETAGDLSGNGHDGQIDLPEWVDGQFGQALQFGGADSGTFVTVDSTDALNVNEMTFMAWVTAESWDGTRQIVGKSVHGGCSGRVQYGLFSDGPNIMLRFETEAGRTDIIAPLPDVGSWAHIAVTNDGTDGIIYIDGTEEGRGAVLGKLGANDDPLRIAQDCDRPQYVFAGAIDEARLWNRALTADEIKQFMNQGAEILSGSTAIEPQNKLATTWATVKHSK
jgi:hypothetical protein